MPVLHLGVIDQPYSYEPPAPKKLARRPSKKTKPGRVAAAPSLQTTGSVAEILEDKYHIMEIFWEQHKGDIMQYLEDSLSGTLENMLLGAPVANDPFGQANSQIESLFKAFLSQKEMDKLGYPGIPTMASLLGVSHRFKNKRGPPRPSFIDTGLYESSFKAWID